MKPSEKAFFILEKKGKFSLSSSGILVNLETGNTLDAKCAGYRVASFKYKDRHHHVGIHRLVYLKYGGPIGPNLQINHKDSNRENNNIPNLEVVTQAENNAHARRVGRAICPKGEKTYFSKLKDGEVVLLRDKYQKREISIKDICREFSISKPTAYLMLVGKTYKHLPGAVAQGRSSTYTMKNRYLDTGIVGKIAEGRKLGKSDYTLAKELGIKRDVVFRIRKKFLDP